MKLNENFILRKVVDVWVSIPTNTNIVNFNGMLTFNESGAFLWSAIEQGADSVEALADALCKEYAVKKETALADAEEFCCKLKEIGCLEM